MAMGTAGAKATATAEEATTSYPGKGAKRRGAIKLRAFFLCGKWLRLFIGQVSPAAVTRASVSLTCDNH